VQAFDDRRHFYEYSARDDHHIGLARSSTDHFGTESGNIIFRRHTGSHFDEAAG
jgi:hypothetical protein